MKKRALITGITGMDGSHLADFLLKKDYEVFGVERRTSTKNRVNTSHLVDKVNFLMGDLTDQNSLTRCLRESEPHEVYNLASQSFVGESWNTPEQSADVTGAGVLRMLEAIRESNIKDVKFYQASTSEMFGKMEDFANEDTPFYPRSPYGVAKLYGHWITVNYKESYDMFNVCGILFNHEGERRGKEFVSRKITDAVARIHLGLQDYLTLGNLDVKRDWGYAPDFVEAMWMMLQQEEPNNYVIATGDFHTLGDFLDCAFRHIGVTDWKPFVKQDKKYMRPADVFYLRGDSERARKELGWKPKTSFDEMVSKMVQNDIELNSYSHAVRKDFSYVQSWK